MIMEAFCSGLSEGLAPYALMSILAFYVLLSYYAVDFISALFIGAGYFVSTLFALIVLQVGSYDGVLFQPELFRAAQGVYSFLGTLWVVVGVRFLCGHWYQRKQIKNVPCKKKFPVFLKEVQEGVVAATDASRLRRILRFIRIILYSVFLGWFLTVLSGFWQGEYPVIFYSYVMSGQGQGSPGLLWAAYCAGRLVPFFVILSVVLCLTRVQSAEKQQKWICVISSAFCVSAGLGIIWIQLASLLG